MARDPLAALRRLRSLEVLEARRVLVDRQAALRQAEAAAAEAAARLESEAALAADLPGGAADYAAWVPLGRAACDRQRVASDHAAALAEISRTALAGTRAAENAVEQVLEMRQERAALAAARRDQAMLDEIGGRRPR
jgi:hypothetical protein